MTDDVEWGPPPPPANGRIGKGRWFVVVAMLKTRPGEWAQIPGEHTSSTAAHLAAGRLGGATKGQVEATGRFVPGSDPVRSHVWARWVGDTDESHDDLDAPGEPA